MGLIRHEDHDAVFNFGSGGLPQALREAANVIERHPNRYDTRKVSVSPLPESGFEITLPHKENA